MPSERSLAALIPTANLGTPAMEILEVHLRFLEVAQGKVRLQYE